MSFVSFDRRTPAARHARPITIAAALVVASLVVSGVVSPFDMPAFAQQQQQVAEDQPAEPSEALLGVVEDFYHTAAIANYAAANAFGRQVLDAVDEPEALLEAFERVHRRRPNPLVGLDEQFVRFQNIPQIAEVSGEIVDVVNEGRQARATRLSFLRQQVERLGDGGIAYRNATENLRNSGEFAAPVLLNTLLDPSRADLQNPIRRALADLGLPMVAPLLAALAADDAAVKVEAILALGELGYPEAVPFILEQVEAGGGTQVQQAATVALGRLGYTGGSNAAAEFYRVAEGFWLNRSPLRPDDRFEGANLWRWENGVLAATNVPAAVYDELMAMRTAGKTLSLADRDGGRGGRVQDDALALWLASNYRREIELPDGAVDPSRPANDPTAGYFGTQAGVPYLMAVLDRVAGERNLPRGSRYDTSAVAFAAIRSLQDVIGQSTLDAGSTPLTRAMQFPDRRVAIEAALALAQALPTSAIEGGEQVVPLLVEALAQTGEANVLLVLADGDELNAASSTLQAAGNRVQTATNAAQAAEVARAMAGVDVLVIDENLGDVETDNLLAAARGTPNLRGTAKLFLTQTRLSRFEQLRDTDPTIATTTGRQGEQLVRAVTAAREQVGGLSIDVAGANTLATRAGELLLDIGLGASVFSLESGREQLLSALDDDRPDIRQLASRIVALLEGGEPQAALLSLAADATAPEPVRVAAFEGLAASAKRQGNLLDGTSVDGLLNVARSEELPGVRSAAAQAVGALALPVDQARRLIIEDTAATTGTAAG